eukprot:CAMPEP_0181436766 /NCGR_PEP_ID=MMETSP1110-20121109/21020_1 /TAXON_ID=174948 /ORGANISM="Symbiodinium sp., Strain CCMP421" /LENGTH=67 /DNA_ID=CAMNT_0023560347 /DNA_START=28 /DNA_END=228 /DNA_ORIENTATION=+
MAQRAAALLAVAGFGLLSLQRVFVAQGSTEVTSSHPESGHGSSSWMELQTPEASTTTTAFDGLLRFA